jgi:hypothetical protein
MSRADDVAADFLHDGLRSERLSGLPRLIEADKKGQPVYKKARGDSK